MEQFILDQAYRDGTPLPDSIKNAPELWTGLAFFYNAFMELTTCRPFGMGEGPVPWTAVNTYCDVKGIHGDQRTDMLYHIGSLDRTYIKYKIDEAEAKAKAK